jgi:hypothetical protein
MTLGSGSSYILNRGRLSCQDSKLCEGQLSHLTSELEDAKKQIRFLVRFSRFKISMIETRDFPKVSLISKFIILA